MNQIVEWKKALQDNASAIFDGFKKQELRDVKALEAKIGQLTMENVFFRKCAHQGGIAERKKMIQQDHQLPLGKQTELLGFSRGMMYYEPHPLSQKDLNLMNEIDTLHLKYPFMGTGTRMLVQ